jgi:hypothetical protein
MKAMDSLISNHDHDLTHDEVEAYLQQKINFYSYLREHKHRFETQASKTVIQRRIDESHRFVLYHRVKAYKEYTSFQIDRWIPCLWYKASQRDSQLRYILYLTKKLEDVATDLELDMNYPTEE